MSRDLMTLMKYHTEAGSERRWKPYNGGTAGAWSNGGYLRVLSGHLSVRMMNSVYPENKRDSYVTSLSLSCAVGTSVIFFPLFSPLLRVPYYVVGLLYHSLFRKNLKWTQVPRSSLLREAIAEGRLSVAMRKLWEAGSRPRVCRAGDVLSRLLSVGKASRQVSNPMAIRNGYGKSCGGDGERALCDLCENFFPSGNHG